MFTSFDKAIVAFVMGGLYLLNYFFGFNIVVSEEQMAAIISVLTPLVIYLVPNKPTA